MKMKKLYIIAMTVIGMMFGGCNDFLEENVRGQENLDTYFQNADEAEAFIMGCYGSITEYTWWKSSACGCCQTCAQTITGWVIHLSLRRNTSRWRIIRVSVSRTAVFLILAI